MRAAADGRGRSGGNGARFLRAFAIIGWAVVAVVLLRIGWGGWPGGIWYVIGIEPAVGLIVGVTCLVGATGMALAMAVGHGRRRSLVSAVGSVVVFAYGLYLLRDGHESGALIVAVSIALLPVSVRLATDPAKTTDA